MCALDNASTNDQIDANGGHRPTELESGDGQVIWRYVKMLPKYDGAQRRCDRESRKGWERRIRPRCANGGGVNCRAVLKDLYIYWNLYTFSLLDQVHL